MTTVLKTRIAQSLGIQISPLHTAIQDAGLEIKDVYTTEESEAIVAAYHRRKDAKVARSTPQSAKGDRHAQTKTGAQVASTKGGALASGHIQAIGGKALAYVERAEAQRGQIVEDLSDRIAYVLDERTLIAESFTRAIEKVGEVDESFFDQLPQLWGGMTIEVPTLPAAAGE